MSRFPNSWPSSVRKVADGEKVDAAVTNRGADDLENRTDYLKLVMEAFQAGRAIVHFDAPLSPDTEIGSPVYYDTNYNFYAKAIATYAYTDGTPIPTAGSQCVGVVVAKQTDSLGAVCLFGLIEGIDISGITGIGEAPTQGTYYLDPSTAGEMTNHRPPLALAVIYLLAKDKFFVGPMFSNSILEHRHYKFVLDPYPASLAGTNVVGGHYVIGNPDATVSGWLPATSEYFPDATIPELASFGYNIAKDPDLAAVWPPGPPEGATLLVDGIQAGPCLVVINSSGIWWISSLPGETPWPGEETSIEGPFTSLDVDCSRLVLQMSKMTGADNLAFVTSLNAVTPLEVVNSLGAPAERGDLVVRLKALTETTGSPATDGVAEWTPSAVVTTSLVSGVRGTGSLRVSGTSFTVGEGALRRTFYKGLLVLDGGDSAASLDGDIELVALNDVMEAKYQETLYLSFPYNRESSIRGKLSVPRIELPADGMLKLSFWILSTGAGACPSLSLTYRIHSLPELNTQQALTSSDTAAVDLAPSLDQASMSAYHYILLESEEIAVQAGDVVFFTLGRGLADGYAYDVGLLNARWKISTPE